MKDVHRCTTKDDPFYTEEILKSIGRIITAYIQRNHQIVYMQGMLFIIARLRKVLSEEETFWTFATILEVYLPPDHYSRISGIELHLMVLS
jgi:hypothetical protein